VIAPGSAAANVPIQKVYLITTTGGFDGVIGKSIIELHRVNGNSYSDFMEIHFVTAPQGYMEDTFKSVVDVTNSGDTLPSAEILVNLPVVPVAALLQHSVTKGASHAHS